MSENRNERTPMGTSEQQAKKMVEEAKDRFWLNSEEENLILTYAQKYDDPDRARQLIEKLEQAVYNSDPVAVVRALHEAKEQIDRLPDNEIGLSEMHAYGYRQNDMYPLTQEKALELHRIGFKIYCLQSDGTADTFSSREMIQEHAGIFGIRKADWDFELDHMEDEHTEDMAYLHPPMSILEKEEALQLFDAGETIYLITTNPLPVAVNIRLEIEWGSDYFQVSTEALEKTRQIQLDMKKYPELESLREAKLLLENKDRYGIYQLRMDSPAVEEMLNQSMNSLQRRGYSVERDNYHLVYTDHLYPADTLESIYARFNQERQPDFDGPSLSISDVIVLNRNGVQSAYYVDSLGFQKLDDFLPQLAVPESSKEKELMNGPVTMNSKGIEVDGHEGTWHPVEMQELNGKQFFLLKHETYGDSVAKVIVDDDGILFAEDLWNGFDKGAKKAIAECCIDAGLPITPDLLFGDRYAAIETSDAFEEPFALYDKLTAQYYCADGIVQTFETLEEAQEQAGKLSEQYRAEISAERPESEKDQMLEPTIRFYVAECMEFPVLGEYHDNLTLEEAYKLYQAIPAERLNGIKGIGFRLEDGSDYDGDYELMRGDVISRDLIALVPHYQESPLVQKAITDLDTLLSRQSERNKAAEKPQHRVGEKQSVLQALRDRQAKQKEREQARGSKKVQAHRKEEQEL